MTAVDARAAHRAAVLQHGREAVAFAGLKSGLSYWRDRPEPEGSGASVAYADTGRTWVAVGSPVVHEARLEEAVHAFVAAARAAGSGACFFGVEGAAPPLHNLRALRIGAQPVFVPRAWPEVLRGAKRLREQLRRARKKGVVVRAVAAADLVADAPLGQAARALARAWLDAHHIEPMGFVVQVEPLYLAADHRYLVAERDGELVGLLSAVPIPARRGWLVEDVFRAASAPNGTSELMLDALMRLVASDEPAAELVTLGLAPLADPVAPWLRAARVVMRPLYDFAGLHAYKRRLRPTAWEPVWLVHPPRRRVASLFGALRAFAGGALVPFAVRSLARHPSGPPFVLGVPLVPWTLLLAVLALAGLADRLGFSTAELWGWVAFDALLALALHRAARRPRVGRLVLATGLGALDAILSLVHLARVGLGRDLVEVPLRAVATLAPVLGTLALVWAVVLARRRARQGE